MCRSIKPLFNFDPPATDEDVTAAALQFVRKISGFTKPSKANAPVFDQAVAAIAEASRLLLATLETQAPPKSRLIEMRKAQARAELRFGQRPIVLRTATD